MEFKEYENRDICDNQIYNKMLIHTTELDRKRTLFSGGCNCEIRLYEN